MSKTINQWHQRTLDGASKIRMSKQKYDDHQPDTLVWCSSCQKYIRKRNAQTHDHTRANRYVGIDALKNRSALLTHAAEIINWGLQDWEDATVESATTAKKPFIGGSFDKGYADPPVSDLDIIAQINVDDSILEMPIDTLQYQLESSVYPSRVDELYQYIELNITDIDILVNVDSTL